VLNGLDLFSGIGGLSVALAPWVKPIAYCEIDEYCRAVLLSRMAVGTLYNAPIWDDVCTLKATHLPRVDIIYGGFPCTDLSDASRGRGKGLRGQQSGLWYEMLQLVAELRPGNVFIENVAGAAWKRWLPFVRRDLYDLGYASLPLCVRATVVGAPFKGDRLFVAATYRKSESALALNAEMARLSEPTGSNWRDWGQPPASAMGMADGLPGELDRVHALGNAVVPAQAREAFRRLMGLR
jgi:DNA (cytosine-5)-methyltransferase 1